MSKVSNDSKTSETIKNAKRILLKLSGEALMGGQNFGIDTKIVEQISKDIADVANQGKEVCIVIGGGNIWRGTSGAEMGIDRVSADNMGMLATIINALALQTAIEKHGIVTRVQSAIPMNSVCEPYIRRRAMRHMEKGRVVIFAGGVGSPFFTTDTCAALRATEMHCDLLLKGTKVDGIYDEDPVKNPNAKHFQALTYKQVLNNDAIEVMDSAAIALTKDNHLPLIVFSIKEAGNFKKVLDGKGQFTFVSNQV